MKTRTNSLEPGSFFCFFGGLLSAIALYACLYFIGLQYLHWPVQRLLGPVAEQGSPFAILIYLSLYVLLFWGLITLSYKKSLVKSEQSALVVLDRNIQGSAIISKPDQLRELRAKVTESGSIRKTILVETLIFLIDHCLVTESSQRVVEIFTRRMDTLQKEIESSYNILRYIAWAIPSLGFIGTVLGIGAALANAGLGIDNIELVTHPLGMAFDTTLIALVESIVLMFFMYNMQHREEQLLNAIDLFCQERFIINLRLE